MVDAERARRDKQMGDLQDWAKELRALGQILWGNDTANGWSVPIVRRYPELHVPVMVDSKEWCRFSRDEHGLIGVWGSGEPQRYITARAAFDDAVKRRKILRLG